MAKSKFEYVKKFESHDICLPNTWIVVRLDGRGFHKFSDAHQFTKPNDEGALNLMNKCAECTLQEFQDICLAYGQSDEYSFIFKRQTNIFGRRTSKIISTVGSYFSSCYVFYWSQFIKIPLQYPPTFDSRLVLYPTDINIQDYLCWRQTDCHINNLYNTCFWNLVKSGLSYEDAQKRLSVTQSAQKHELLFSEFRINYNNEPEQFKKGSILVWEEFSEQISQPSDKFMEITKIDKDDQEKVFYRKRKRIVCSHVDVRQYFELLK